MSDIIELEQKLKELNIDTTRKLTMRELINAIAEEWLCMTRKDQKEILEILAKPPYNKNEIIDILTSIKDDFELSEKQKTAINIGCNLLKENVNAE